ncbi:MAG: hypothetical protein JXB49_11795 [Bacteroidales bacterium]|nr:hypothetical protein [Bacteroidales bacterium]
MRKNILARVFVICMICAISCTNNGNVNDSSKSASKTTDQGIDKKKKENKTEKRSNFITAKGWKFHDGTTYQFDKFLNGRVYPPGERDAFIVFGSNTRNQPEVHLEITINGDTPGTYEREWDNASKKAIKSGLSVTFERYGNDFFGIHFDKGILVLEEVGKVGGYISGTYTFTDGRVWDETEKKEISGITAYGEFRVKRENLSDGH